MQSKRSFHELANEAMPSLSNWAAMASASIPAIANSMNILSLFSGIASR
jgi:hypothetical protein